MIRAAILGSTGYAGAELVRLLLAHPQVELAFLDSNRYEGTDYTDLYPHLRGQIDQKCTNIDLKTLEGVSDIDVYFCALPHGLTQDTVVSALKSGAKVIDLSADFRLRDPQVYEAWYDTDHHARDILKEAVYGLPEIYRDQIKGARLIANPGCYPTSVIAALYPLLQAGLISPEGIISDSKSGTSGAGRGLSDGNLYCQVNENISPYKVASHRHTPEIEQELSCAAGEPVTMIFTPHLVPMNRGILSTIYTKATRKLTREEVDACYADLYKDEPFIRLLPQGVYPKTKAISGTNLIDIAYALDERTGSIIVMSAIDNLVRGAAGQAVQNMNLMFGFPEKTAIDQMPLWP